MISQDFIFNWLGRPLLLPDKILPLIANWNPAHLFRNIIPALKAGGVDDAQDEAGHGRLKPVTPRRDCFVFFHVEENEESLINASHRIGKTSPVPPPEVES